MHCSEAVLRQIVQDFDSLAELLERAIDAIPCDEVAGAELAALERAREGAEVARRAIV